MKPIDTFDRMSHRLVFEKIVFGLPNFSIKQVGVTQ